MYYYFEHYDNNGIYFRPSSRRPKAQVKVPWTNGQPLRRPPTSVLEFDIDDNHGVMMPDYFDADVPIFSTRLLNLFEQSGVDNILSYPVILVNSKTGEKTCSYHAINIIGLIQGTDDVLVEDEDSQPINFMCDPDNLLINPENCLGLLCFRLRENMLSIIVHEAIASKLPLNEYRGLRLRPVISP